MADAVSTHVCLARGDGAEANPLVAAVIDRFGFPGLYALKLGVCAYSVHEALQQDNYYERERGYVLLGLFGALPAVNNLFVLRA